MRRIILLCVVFVPIIAIYGQQQTGIVKTKGRKIGGQIVSGQGIPGVMINIKGRNTILSNNNGQFSFPVSGKLFQFIGITKNGYELIDQDACREYKYTSDPLVLLMDKPENQKQDRLVAERKLRRTLERRLHEREDEIDALKTSVAEKQKLLEELYKSHQKDEILINDMAEHYSKIDYDQLNDFQQEVCDCILDGDLEKADSLIKSKGDINVRYEQLQSFNQANVKAKAELEKNEKLAAKVREELAKDCYNRFDIFRLRHQNDSAAYYIEMCANIDSVDVEMQNEAGNFLARYIADYQKAIFYYQREINEATRQYDGNSEWIPRGYNNIGAAYQSINGKENAEKSYEYYKRALASFLGGSQYATFIFKEELDDGVVVDTVVVDDMPYLLFDNDTLDMDKLIGNIQLVGTICNNIATHYQDKQEYERALRCYHETLAIYREQDRIGILGNPSDSAVVYHNIGYMYSLQKDYENAKKNCAIAIRLYEDDLMEYSPLYVTMNKCMSEYNQKSGDFAKALEYLSKAYDIHKTIYGDSRSSFGFVENFSNLCDSLEEVGDLPKAIECEEQILDIYSKEGERFVLKRAYRQWSIALKHEALGNIDFAMAFYHKTIEIAKHIVDDDSSIQTTNKRIVSSCCHALANIYFDREDYVNSIENYEMAIQYLPQTANEDSMLVASWSQIIASLYEIRDCYADAAKYYEKALTLYKELSPDSISLIDGLQEDLLIMRYLLSVKNETVSDFMLSHIFYITCEEGNTPARQQGMSGEYVLLEFADWSFKSKTSIYAKNMETKGLPVDIVILRNGKIEKHHFEDKIGIQYHLKEISKKENEDIEKLYDKWKELN